MMTRGKAVAYVLLHAWALASCSLITDFDRSRIPHPDAGRNDTEPDAELTTPDAGSPDGSVTTCQEPAVVEPACAEGEVCPAACDDGTACTIDTQTSTGPQCGSVCEHTEIMDCRNGDGCCPSQCDSANDDDCTLSCGNGITELGETCDPTTFCPTDCNDGTACTIDTKLGSIANCNVMCSFVEISTCIGGDLCCPSACNANTDSDCSVTCNNGVVELGETCDPPGSCPVTCDDGNACTIDGRTGSEANCNVACSHQTITQCQSRDGCCPAGCNATNDSDCSASCNNGVIEPGETCDPPGSCPTPQACNDGTACTIDNLTGSSANCTATCSHQTISQCVSGDGCCPGGCNAVNDRDCSASCNNSVVEPGETCDPPGSCPRDCSDGSACTIDTLTGNAANCTAACGHQTISQCKAGDGCCPAGCNAVNDSDCSASCGNRVVEPGETCDPVSACPVLRNCNDGNACTIDNLTGNAASCTAACTHQTITQCKSGDGCCAPGCDANTDHDCSATCGNRVVEPGETCDPQTSCPTTCNDGTACTIDTPTGSAANCNLTCSHQAITQCKAGDGCCPSGCNANADSDCSPSCGNSIIERGETCDPPGTCPTTCTSAGCVQSTLSGSAATCNAACSNQTITQCQNGDTCCPASCTLANDDACSASCGDGVVSPPERCDPNAPAGCPTLASCADSDACTADSLAGSAASCSAECSHQRISQCQNADGCCPSGCSNATDSDCAAPDAGVAPDAGAASDAGTSADAAADAG